MVYVPDGSNYIVRLEKGERLSEGIEQFIQEIKLPGAWVSGLGSVTELSLGFYDLEKQQYEWRDFGGLHEIVSLTGNLAFDEAGKLISHLHGVFGDREFQTVGGHVKDFTAAATVELFVYPTKQTLARKFDPAVGLSTLDL